MKFEEIEKRLDERYVRGHGRTKWLLHRWDTAGTDQGFELVYYAKGDVFIIEGYTASGYMANYRLCTITTTSELDKWVECFKPTNPEFIFS